MGITWNDLEKTFNTLAQDQSVVQATTEIFSIQGKIVQEANEVLAGA
jgi:hypothetical protein